MRSYLFICCLVVNPSLPDSPFSEVFPSEESHLEAQCDKSWSTTLLKLWKVPRLQITVIYFLFFIRIPHSFKPAAVLLSLNLIPLPKKKPKTKTKTMQHCISGELLHRQVFISLENIKRKELEQVMQAKRKILSKTLRSINEGCTILTSQHLTGSCTIQTGFTKVFQKAWLYHNCE